MKIHKANWLLLIVSSAAMAGCTTSKQYAATQSPNAYVGLWSGADPTSLEILSEEPLSVRYCFKDNCTNYNPAGTVDNMTIHLRPRRGRGKATILAVKTETGYSATFKRVGSHAIHKTVFKKPKLKPAQ